MLMPTPNMGRDNEAHNYTEAYWKQWFPLWHLDFWDKEGRIFDICQYQVFDTSP